MTPPERRENENGRDRRKGERRQEARPVPLDRREPWFSEGAPWRVWCRKKIARLVMWGFDHGWISPRCMAILITYWRPQRRHNDH